MPELTRGDGLDQGGDKRNWEGDHEGSLADRVSDNWREARKRGPFKSVNECECVCVCVCEGVSSTGNSQETGLTSGMEEGCQTLTGIRVALHLLMSRS